MLRRTALALVPLAVVAGAAGCSRTPDAAPPDQALSTAKQRLDEASTVHVELTSQGVPKGKNGVTAAKGDGIVSATQPKFEGEVTATIQGNNGAVRIIAIGEKTWMSFFTEDYNPIDLSELGAPNPSGFFVPEKGLSRLLTETTGVSAGEAKRQGDTVLQTYSGALPGAPVDDLLGLGDGKGTFQVTYGIDQASGELRTADISGPFWTGSTSTYTVKLSDYGKPVTIETPR